MTATTFQMQLLRWKVCAHSWRAHKSFYQPLAFTPQKYLEQWHLLMDARRTPTNILPPAGNTRNLTTSSVRFTTTGAEAFARRTRQERAQAPATERIHLLPGSQSLKNSVAPLTLSKHPFRVNGRPLLSVCTDSSVR